MSENTPTPRTDALKLPSEVVLLLGSKGVPQKVVDAILALGEHARQLERDLDAAEARIKRLEEALRECLAAWGRDGVKADNNSPEVRGRAQSVLED